MKAKKNIFLIIALLCLGCGGCAKESSRTEIESEISSEEIRQTESKVSKQEFPKRFEKTINGVLFDMEIRI